MNRMAVCVHGYMLKYISIQNALSLKCHQKHGLSLNGEAGRGGLANAN